jgi:hypothetical protein
MCYFVIFVSAWRVVFDASMLLTETLPPGDIGAAQGVRRESGCPRASGMFTPLSSGTGSDSVNSMRNPRRCRRRSRTLGARCTQVRRKGSTYQAAAPT